jgi:hypothetical protein
MGRTPRDRDSYDISSGTEGPGQAPPVVGISPVRRSSAI